MHVPPTPYHQRQAQRVAMDYLRAQLKQMKDTGELPDDFDIDAAVRKKMAADDADKPARGTAEQTTNE